MKAAKALLLFLIPQTVFAACETGYFPSDGAEAKHRVFWCDTATDLPGSGVVAGDLVYLKDTHEFKAADSTTSYAAPALEAPYTLKIPNGTTPTAGDCDAAGEAGRLYFDTDATSGRRLYGCQGVSGWILQGDGDSGGSPAWGTVTGTLSAQTDLQSALDAKVASGGALGTPSSGTLTNATGLPVAGIAASTSTALGVGSLELGHASDTTLARVSAGLMSVEGATLLSNTATSGVAATPTANGTQQITHSLGRTPTIIRIYGHGAKVSSTSASNNITSMGVYSSSGNTCIYVIGGASAGQASSTAFAIEIGTSAGNVISGVIGNVGATTFDIVWTEAGTSVAGVLLWEAQ